MTPGARVQAAIEALDRVVAGEAAEKVLTSWARGARHAGSKDRAAVRDHVFDALRRWWSTAALGGGETGRARMIGLCRAQGVAPDTLFTGQGYAPAPLTEAEQTVPPEPDALTALDCPDWLAPRLQSSLGDAFAPVMTSLQDRAPVFLRVHAGRADVASIIAELARDGIIARPHALASHALEVTEGARRVHLSEAYADGRIEVQDAASQAVCDMIPLQHAARVLDYCAGGGGKVLALAARHDATFHAHDVDAARMRDLPPRAARAGTPVALRETGALTKEQPYDVVLVDAPCSGSGAWRRSPEGKLRLTPERLDALVGLQTQIIAEALTHVAPGRVLAYATCSLLSDENELQTRAAMARHGMTLETERHLTPLDGGDGFYCAILRRNP
ncbi:Ribosomal RNA small subunit methyltransferase B [Rhodobacteraceae bacterium THAF1]|uniref:RsmB/NOP family class I SAM-dependent RNA methyltransferase n=1 Tax=Palleronia sp. THAF1 TaxID=2587842 RepID=UPI000F3D9C99|nr:RsmB/NOP family class I SAM-dependent RNA methyltransferase [Palleronia sp. THAF1]QFU08602.1 Ribosomal RNA small subunit methyltransferase B [Palleronia sp. THAF1]VDC30701.1 Ribosomal RNA small subunit methyltransferase B [Rhodobacteraceae bacterium THAF1]